MLNFTRFISSLSRHAELFSKYALVRRAIWSVGAGRLYSNDCSMWLATQRVMGHTNLGRTEFENVTTARTSNKDPGKRWQFGARWPTRNDVLPNAMRAIDETDRGHGTPRSHEAWHFATHGAPVKSDR